MTLVKFPSIEQFRNTVKDVQHYSYAKNGARDENGELLSRSQQTTRWLEPVLTFEGTVKLHGTNAGVVVDLNGNDVGPITLQSRERVLSLTADNAGFYAWGMQNTHQNVFLSIAQETAWAMRSETDRTVSKVAIFGEWCGGNIQKSVAICELPKMFVIFGLQVIFDDQTHVWIQLDKDKSTFFVNNIYDIIREVSDVYLIWEFQTWSVEIDFNKPQEVQNKLIEITEAIEAECPVGKHFGVSGIGEGAVWTCYLDNGSALRFKVKGDKHSVSRVKKLASVDVEKINTVNEFVESVVTENRLQQGIAYLKEQSISTDEMSSIGPFLKWVVGDIFKEESDTIISNQLDAKMIAKSANLAARRWFLEYVNADRGS